MLSIIGGVLVGHQRDHVVRIQLQIILSGHHLKYLSIQSFYWGRLGRIVRLHVVYCGCSRNAYPETSHGLRVSIWPLRLVDWSALKHLRWQCCWLRCPVLRLFELFRRISIINLVHKLRLLEFETGNIGWRHFDLLHSGFLVVVPLTAKRLILHLQALLTWSCA